MNISDQSETYRKGGYNVSQEVGTVDSYSNACNSVPLKSSEKQKNCTTEYQKNATVYGAESQQTKIMDMSLQNEQSPELHHPVVSKTCMNAEEHRSNQLLRAAATLRLPLGKIYGGS